MANECIKNLTRYDTKSVVEPNSLRLLVHCTVSERDTKCSSARMVRSIPLSVRFKVSNVSGLYPVNFLPQVRTLLSELTP